MDIKQEFDLNNETALMNLDQASAENSLDRPDYVRIKLEHNEWNNSVLPTNTNEVIKIKNGDIKLERHFEYCDTTQLSNEFGIKNGNNGSVDTTSDLMVIRVKDEHCINEKWDQCNFPIKGKREAVFIKSETEKEMFKEDIDTPLLNEELDIKYDIDANANEISGECLKNVAKNINWEQEHQALHSGAALDTLSSYDCKYATSKKYNLVNHTNIDNSNIVNRSSKLEECIHCKAQFKRKVLLDDHITKYHPNFITSVTSKLHECTNCTFKTTNKKSLAHHMLKHPETVSSYEFHTCSQCNTAFTSKAALDNHIIKKHPNFISSVTNQIHECPICGFKTTFKHGMIKHMSRHPEAPSSYDMHKCPHCNAAFKNEISLENHIVMKHPNFTASVNREVFECTKCTSYRTTIQSHLEKHILECPKTTPCENSVICLHCDSPFKNKISLDDHIVKQHPDFDAAVTRKLHKCEKCGYKTTRKNCFDRHILKHPEIATGFNYTMCIHCNGAFTNKTLLDEHIIKQHPQFIASVTSKIYECETCLFKTTNKGGFTRHISKHSGLAPSYKPAICVPCNHCTKDFKSKKCLDDHIIKKHPNFIKSVTSKVHECRHCSYKTTLRNHLAKHQLKHSKCMHCSELFTSKLALDNHIIEKHPDFITSSVDSPIYECTKCVFKTTMKNNLTQHIIKHHDAMCGNKPNLCMHCNEAFRTKKGLEEHIIRKHPDFAASVNCKLHECSKCDYKTTRTTSLSRHMMEHPDTAASYNFSVCEHCKKVFKSKINLHYHILKKHPSHIGSITSKIHECSKCLFKTTHRNQLVQHMLKHTGIDFS